MHASKEKVAIFTTFNQKSNFNDNKNYYQTQIDSFILNSQPNQELVIDTILKSTI